MSEEENIAIVRQAIRHLNETGEPDWELYDPELVWTSRADGPAHMTYRGIDGLRRGIASMRGVWAEFKAEIEDITAEDDRVVSVLRWRLRAQSGVELEEVEGWATWLRDGKITRIEQHASKQEALESARLPDWRFGREAAIRFAWKAALRREILRVGCRRRTSTSSVGPSRRSTEALKRSG